MKILIACEFSGVVRRAFAAQGHDAWSCDLLPANDNSPNHLQQDVFDTIASQDWDMMIAHPPCTYLTSAGLHWNHRTPGRQEKTEEAIRFVGELLNSNIPQIALENPIGCLSTQIRTPTQIIQPWQFGHGETKATCLWLKNLPKLVPTDVVEGRSDRIHKMPPGPNRWKERSRTYQGIADAMAEQWSDHIARSEALAA